MFPQNRAFQQAGFWQSTPTSTGAQATASATAAAEDTSGTTRTQQQQQQAQQQQTSSQSGQSTSLPTGWSVPASWSTLHPAFGIPGHHGPHHGPHHHHPPPLPPPPSHLPFSHSPPPPPPPPPHPHPHPHPFMPPPPGQDDFPFPFPGFGGHGGYRRGKHFKHGWWNVPTNGKARPAVDVLDYGTHYVVEIELAGVNKQDVEVRLAEGGRTLTVSGALPRAQKEDDWVGEDIDSPTYIQCGRPLGGGAKAFECTVDLPEAVESDDVKAKMEDGLLRVTAEKSKKMDGIEIKIN